MKHSCHAFGRRVSILIAVLLVVAFHAKAQPLVNPYPFSIGPDVEMDTSLIVGPWDGPTPDRVSIKSGHFVHEDGQPFRMVGTTVQYSACFPDSATAISMAARFRALGINVVRFSAFDYTLYWPISIFADGTTTTGSGLHPTSMARLDWFTHQLRLQGIRYGFTFQGAWVPRPEDGVRQPDSVGSAARMTVLFDPVIQRIHRNVMRLLLTHVNQHTNIAYKDDPGLLFVMPFEDSPLTAYWLYTKDIVPNNPNGSRTVGQQHQKLMDSLFYAYLKGKGLGSDAALATAWNVTPADASEQIRNGGFEDPFDPSWTLNVATNNGGQALLQYTESDHVAGAQCARIRIGKLATPASEGSVNLLQTLARVERLHRYRLSFHAKTTPTKGTRTIRVLLYHNGYPYSSAGVVQEVALTSTWKKFDFEFTASSLEAGSVAMQLQCGNDTGDVYLDEVSFKEISMPGLRPGESIANGTLRRDVYFDGTVTPARMKSNADFYLTTFRNTLEADRRLIRDTLMSKTLLTPSSRMFSRLDQEAGMNYDFFTSTDWRSSAVSPLSDQYGSSINNQAQVDFDTKPLVLVHTAIAYPLPYQHETAIMYPTYAGLHNWDGVFFSLFAPSARTGNTKVDSLSTWYIFDKPNVLTQLPLASNMLRRYDVDTSVKVLQIAQEDEALDYPPFHSQGAYSLSVYSDGRMTLFRRTEVLSKLQPEESLAPQREISALSGNVVDPTTLDAENEQIYFDGTSGILRTVAPRYINIAGTLRGQIVAETDITVEQYDNGEHASIAIGSLTDKPVLESPSNLLVIGGRGLNHATEFNSDGTIARWGTAPFEMEGREIRISMRAPSFDSCRIIPLGEDAKPTSGGVVVPRSLTGRFTHTFVTKQSKSPWFKVEFFNVPSSVSETDQTPLTIAPNPSSDYSYVRTAGNVVVTCYDVLGHVLFTTEGQGEVKLNTSRLPVGQYVLDIAIDGKHTTRPLSVCR